MYCPHCGTLNDPSAKRCAQCTALLPDLEKKNIWKQLYRPGQGLGCLLIIAALAISSLFIISPQYRLYNMQVTLARESVVKNNMRQLRVALDQMAVETDYYPVSLKPGNSEDEEQYLRYIYSVTRQLRNPFDQRDPAVGESEFEPPDWAAFKPGQIVYVPLDVSEGRAAGCAIYGVGKKGLLKDVLRG
ncbi:MAG: zinc ribbon domain-containing protein, partial [bacterium]|nr:zinc ribbon domain-containing protein [bacterium]